MHVINQKCYIAFHSLLFKNNLWNSESIVSVNCYIYKRILHIPNKLTLEILRSFDQRKYPRGHFDPDIFANIFSNFCNFHKYVCETLLE